MDRATFVRSLASTLVLSLVGSAIAQPGDSWPNRPIRIVVPAGAGAGTDFWARTIGEELHKAFGQAVLVDNKPGASGAIGNDMVAKAKPDGYTILFSNASSTSMLQALQPKLPYDLLRDLVPVAQVGLGGVFVVAAPNFPAANMKELVAEVKAHPGKYSYAHFGIGSSGHLIMESLKKREGLDMNDVPYKTIPQILTDLVSGNVKVGIVDVTSSVPFIRSGKIRAIAVTGSKRLPATPTVLTLAEQSFPYDVDGWYGVFVPSGTPVEIVRKLNTVINATLAKPEVIERYRQNNLPEPPRKTPEEFAQTVRGDIAIWSELARANNIRIE